MATATTPTATLITHCGARRVTREGLRALADPSALGTRHRPVRHDVLVDAVHGEVVARGMSVLREEYAVQRDDSILFGVLDLVGEGVQTHALSRPGVAPCLGLRSSTDESFAISIVAGSSRVLVCDNLAFAGDTLALHRKSTSGLELDKAMTEAFDRFLDHSARFLAGLDRLRETPVGDSEAREIIYNALAAEAVPLRLFPHIHRAYFDVDAETRPDCAERTLWGLHNAFTRSFKELTPARAWTANVALGGLFGLRTSQS